MHGKAHSKPARRLCFVSSLRKLLEFECKMAMMCVVSYDRSSVKQH